MGLTALLNFILGIGGEFVTDWKQAREHARQVKQAVTENRIRLAQDAQTHNQAWEMAALEGRDRWLRRFSFALFTFPLIWAGIDAPGARVYFTEALAALPDWYIGVYMGMMGAIWGITELKQWKS